jgi:hypothetical protein
VAVGCSARLARLIIGNLIAELERRNMVKARQPNDLRLTLQNDHLSFLRLSALSTG